jgi:GLPGLI family protein
MRITIILLLYFTFSYSQSNKKFSVVYKASLENFKIESNEPSRIRFILQMKKNIESMEYLLKVNSRASDFETIKKMKLSNKYANPIQRTEDKVRFYVDSISFIEQRDAFDELYIIEEPSKQISWNLLKETKTILGYTCYKASYVRLGSNPVIIEAWYAPELSFQFGPKGYHGLPGLILKVVQGGKFSYTANSIQWNDDIFVIKPTTGIQISREDFDKKVKQAINILEEYNKN